MRYSELAAFYDTLESTSKRLEMTWHIAEFLGKADDDDLKPLVLLLQGRVFPAWDERKIGVAEKLVIKAIAKATGAEQAKIEAAWSKTGDLGKVAEQLCGKKTQMTLFTTELTLVKVFDNIRKLAELEGQGSVDAKTALLAELLASASPREARYIIRTALEQLRLGTGEGTLRDAIAWAFLPKVVGILVPCCCGKLMPAIPTCLGCGEAVQKKFADIAQSARQFAGRHGYRVIEGKELRSALEGKKEFKDKAMVIAESETEARKLYKALVEAVQHAYDVTNDFAKVARDAKQGGIEGLLESSLEVGTPVKVMLAIKEDTIAAAMERVGRPAAAEYKFDGFRMQVHIQGDSVRIFTRRLEEVTRQFPEIVKAVGEKVSVKSAVLDGEAVGFDPATGRYLAFQGVSQRIRRKYGIEEMAKSMPVQLNIFDILLLNGKTVLKEPFEKRRELIEDIVPKKGRYLQLTEQKVSDSEEDITAFFEQALKAGHEGIMLKNLTAEYKPGARVGNMVKYKEVMEGLDLVIVKAEHGEGKRAGWLTSYTLACLGPKGELLEIGKASTGLKEKREEGLSYDEMTELLTPLAKGSGKVFDVTPKLVVEVHYEEIQKSPNYSSGYALRFPRIIRLREDKGKEDASTIGQVKSLYAKQRHRGS